jgi:hypothetical protein
MFFLSRKSRSSLASQFAQSAFFSPMIGRDILASVIRHHGKFHT